MKKPMNLEEKTTAALTRLLAKQRVLERAAEFSAHFAKNRSRTTCGRLGRFRILQRLWPPIGTST